MLTPFVPLRDLLDLRVRPPPPGVEAPVGPRDEVAQVAARTALIMIVITNITIVIIITIIIISSSSSSGSSIVMIIRTSREDRWRGTRRKSGRRLSLNKRYETTTLLSW